ncbi:S-methyl-5'-thioadenosine phosphorylase [Pyrococcus kukulkanii]|uniref:S-methyl-5'-thioadenosine phosphorylase n=1 Tax=Pyrococcus kukulkanii TaxID=1609559 RepID=A0A127B6T6_9EURY|nr:S-methyl-5'-thioadenosine phosphorylase [Pyrococcus kukulkanii]AMM53083.1 5'-methylthioadenosine phosphorylase [Pyrococcus kukulkanii]
MPKIGIIGGSGVYGVFEPKETVKVHTPYGRPSAPVEIGEIEGVEVAFIPRHGKYHEFPPHEVPYRANIWALKELGVERVIGINAVGSLKEEYKPGDIVIIDQFIDFTKKREYTFYNGPRVAHISMADPFCPELRRIFIETAKELGLPVHEKGTYICIEGPRFSTRAESRMFRQFADVIGMTLVPEVNLARELGMCYVNISTVTDYDVWAEKPVDAQEVLRVMKENEEKVQRLLRKAIPKIPEERKCGCADVLKTAFV